MSQAGNGIQPVHCLAWELLNVYVTENNTISVAYKLNWNDRLGLPLAVTSYLLRNISPLLIQMEMHFVSR
jgi:hypothetical protein